MKRGLAFLSLAVVALAPSCKDETIVLASVHGVDGGGGPAVRCTTIDECPTGSFCSKVDCHDAAGTCEPFPAVCGDDEHPVCGCDGITYFNDCLRRGAGVAAARDDECGHEAVGCDDAVSCPEATYCARLLGFGGPPGCPPGIHGTCWILPTTCPPPSHADRWNACAGGSQCVDTCTAIRTGAPHVRASSCP
jgi:hypothetical protein